MKGVSVSGVGKTYDVVDNLTKPVPGPHQVLVKPIYSGLNPVYVSSALPLVWITLLQVIPYTNVLYSSETFMQSSGVLVTAWPIVLGCDASGTVVEVGEGVSKFKVGDNVFGCTRLGIPGYGTFQEYHLMDESITFKTPANVSLEEAATLGVGLLTAGLGLGPGLGLDISKPDLTPKDEWIIILGGSGRYVSPMSDAKEAKQLRTHSRTYWQTC
jgi:NADPH:quinone reductase-like Zn-dependent oxidoreductase